MTDIKALYHNEFMLNLFLSNLEINPELSKNKLAIEKFRNMGRLTG